ncbi:hypothetical protein GCM10009716_08970 [Streptomyces sodiiphilus]|uniref:Integral membrane protein n=1 Tax=Streptomyces sodiiphilus TaxID=226217 RepID=A0ABN2NWX1_9ACTN
MAAALTAGQGAVIAALGLYMLVLLFTSTPDGVLQAVTGALTVLVLSVLPLSAARGLWLLRRWSRGPAVALQVFALPTGWQMIVSGGPWVAAGLALGAVALTVLACLASPTAARALGIGPRAA